MTYILAILAFFATSIAIFEKLWDKINKRFVKPPPLIWIAFIISAATLIFTLIKTYNDAKTESQKQREVYSEYLNLYGNNIWSAPNKIPSGYIIVFYDFECELNLEYGGHSELVQNSDDYRVEIPIVGILGETRGEASYKWSLSIASDVGRCDGTIYVKSTQNMKKLNDN